jgi:hypothetical protein
VALSDTDRVRNLLSTYGDLVDAAHFDALGELMAEARLCDESGTPFATGAAEVAAFYRGSLRLHADGTPRTHHLVLGTRFDEPVGDGGTTEAGDRLACRSSYLVLHQPDGGELRPLITGTYDDVFVRRDAGWCFAERRMGMRLVGDLATHLRFDPTR